MSDGSTNGMQPSGLNGPPPPPPSIGHIPAVRLKSEIPDRRMDPPPCVQNAMMTKDKKPFTYTPGGIDLSEIRSPRMARRIERNANSGGVTDQPQRPQPPSPNINTLPPSALAAMQPQIQVQVLPSGLPQMKSQAPPPPPPPPVNIPPPPPLQPLPTQKVTTTGNQVVERPDMTKIIPDNPMTLLKRTGGPSPRRSFVDEMYANHTVKTPPVVAKSPEFTEPPPPPRYQPQSPPTSYQPPVIERTPSVVEDQPLKTSSAHLGSLYIPPSNMQPQQRIISPPISPPERLQQDSPRVQSPGTPTLKEAPKPWQNRPYQQKQQQQQLPEWAKRDEPQAQQLPQNNNYEEQLQQQQLRQQQMQHQQLRQQQMQQQQLQQQQQQPIHIELHTKQTPSPNPNYRQQPIFDPQQHPNAVFVTQPLIFQHPGGRISGGGGPQLQQHPQQLQQPNNRSPPQQQQNQRAIPQQQGVTRIIPIAIEGRDPPSSGQEKLSRQQSWGNNPSQSNSFKVIQRITQTDDEDDNNQTVTQHQPKYQQNFQQQPMTDRDFVNRFKQDDQESCLRNETDPRYRGAAIPSKAFKLLQNMTNNSNTSCDNVVSNKTKNVPHSPQAASNGSSPQVRTIPIQLEGDNQQQQYIHPSEQVVAEPKKYMGGSIPSRSFKMLQAMTAHDTCGPDQSDL